MPSDRLSPRVDQLPHDVLAELSGRTIVLALQELYCRRVHMCGRAAHNPLLHDMSRYGRARAADLLPHILGPLGLEYGVTAQWYAHNGVLALWLTTI